MTYYAVCDANGPISVMLSASTEDEARAEFASADKRDWIDSARTDAEDVADIDGADAMDESEFAAALEAAGFAQVCDLEAIHNYHSGTSAHLAGGWMLWTDDA